MYCCCNIAITLTIRGCGRHSMARVGHGGVENRSIAEPTRGVTAKPKHPKIDGTFQPNAVPGMTRRIASGAKQFAEKLIFGLSVASNEFSRFGPGCGFPTCCRRSFCCRTWYFSANCKAGTRCSPGGTLKPCPSHSLLSHTSTSRTAAAQHLCRAGPAWAPALHVKSPDPARQDRGWWKCGFG